MYPDFFASLTEGTVIWVYGIGVCTLSHFSHVQLFTTPWTVAHQAPLSMGFSRQEYRSGLPFPSPGDLSDPGIEPMSPAAPTLQADTLPLSHQRSPWYCLCSFYIKHKTKSYLLHGRVGSSRINTLIHIYRACITSLVPT